jgi:putative transposase
MVKLSVTFKLLPDSNQTRALEATLGRANDAANYISAVAWERKSFGKYKLQKHCYYEVRERFSLSAQLVIRLLSKVSDAYGPGSGRGKKRVFKPLGAIAYDDRILSWKESEVSLWTVAGRERIPFVCDEDTKGMLRRRRGQSYLVFRKGKWYLLATVDVEEPPPSSPEDWLGVDLGIKNIAVDSDGETHSGGELRSLRHRYHHLRQRLQKKGTKSAKRLLRKRRKKERRMSRNVNHLISKRLVRKAQRTGCGIALEELGGIRDRTRVRRSQRRTMHSWSFSQLRSFVEYKAKLAGVMVVFVDPRNTSRTCPGCGCVDGGNRPSRDTFSCVSCSFAGEADVIAALNIRSRAVVMQPDADRLIA